MDLRLRVYCRGQFGQNNGVSNVEKKMETKWALTGLKGGVQKERT